MTEESLRSHRVVLSPPNAEWRKAFDRERAAILSALQGVADVVVEHIGSTSIPGIRAKPIIDIMLGVDDEKCLDGLREGLEALGYEYDVAALRDDPGRRVYRKGSRELRTHQVHATVIGSFLLAADSRVS